MQTRKLGILGILAVALAVPGISLAKSDKNGTQHGIDKGGVPALRDALQGQIDTIEGRIDDLEELPDEVADIEARLQALEDQFVDDDGDTFTEIQNDCDDEDAAVNPLATEVAGNGIDDDCDHVIDEP